MDARLVAERRHAPRETEEKRSEKETKNIEKKKERERNFPPEMLTDAKTDADGRK